MNRRLQQFLDIEQLTPSRLADILGIQRSGISHILSGRNKPGYDFLFKFIQKFPQVNAEWLITGKGKPLKEQEYSGTTLPTPPESEETGPVFSNDEPASDEMMPETERKAEKSIKRITVFYSDGSFEELFPNR